jgi:hypothetical protein
MIFLGNLAMASNYCCFCGIVGSQPISNDLTSFNYSCLEVKKKDAKSKKKKDFALPTDPEVYNI